LTAKSLTSFLDKGNTNMRILLVDDDRRYLEMLSSLLQSRGHKVFPAEEGKEARELLEAEQVDLIISDVVMPTLDGVWFHSYVREFSNLPDVPFIFISGNDKSLLSELVIQPDKDLSLSKALGPEALVNRIEMFVTGTLVGARK
jgi:DNA-binding response OmpR family regulator